MITNLLDISKGHFTDIAIAKAANFLGENNQATYKALNVILPTLLGGMANKSSTSEGAQDLMQQVKATQKVDMSGNLGTLMSGNNQTQTLIGVGRDVVNNIFDKKSGHIADWIATHANIKIASANSLMNMVAPVLIHLISQRSGSSANSFVGLLNEQLPILREANLPEGLVKVANLDLTSQANLPKIEEGVTESIDFTKLIPWAVLALVLVAGIYIFKTCDFSNLMPKPIDATTEAPKTTSTNTPSAVNQPAQTTTSTATDVHRLVLPEGTIEIPKGSFLDKLYIEINDPKADLTKALTLDSIYFKNASARLTPESINQATELSKILKAFPTVEIRIEGHTDNFGIPDKNMRLSYLRAAAVKRFLVRNGIAQERILTEGLGDTKPIADNATPEGMAKNRRIEVYVTKK
ncbi:MAG: OmpA family protein [Saprospiraceae bacterium]|nr:OmpA family protein [Saprospiraceae bacterium]